MPVVFVGLECRCFGGQRGTPLQPGGALEDRPADGFRPAQAGGFQLSQRPEGCAASLQADGMLPSSKEPVATLEETSKRSSVMNADLQDW